MIIYSCCYGCVSTLLINRLSSISSCCLTVKLCINHSDLSYAESATLLTMVMCFLNFYPRNAMLARVIAIATCPYVTRRYCVKRKKASGMISLPSGSPKTLVFWCQISSSNSKGFPPNGSLKQGSVGKIQRFSSFKHQYLENGSRYGLSYY